MSIENIYINFTTEKKKCYRISNDDKYFSGEFTGFPESGMTDRRGRSFFKML